MRKMNSAARRFPHLGSASISKLSRSSQLSFKSRYRIPTANLVRKAIKKQMITPYTGVSLAAIKKYIRQNYENTEIDVNKRLPFIKKYIAKALNNRKLVRTTGSTGVSGSFRLPLKKAQKTIVKSKQRKMSINKERAIKDQLQTKIKADPSVEDLQKQIKDLQNKLKVTKNLK